MHDSVASKMDSYRFDSARASFGFSYVHVVQESVHVSTKCSGIFQVIGLDYDKLPILFCNEASAPGLVELLFNRHKSFPFFAYFSRTFGTVGLFVPLNAFPVIRKSYTKIVLIKYQIAIDQYYTA